MMEFDISFYLYIFHVAKTTSDEDQGLLYIFRPHLRGSSTSVSSAFVTTNRLVLLGRRCWTGAAVSLSTVMTVLGAVGGHGAEESTGVMKADGGVPSAMAASGVLKADTETGGGRVVTGVVVQASPGSGNSTDCLTGMLLKGGVHMVSVSATAGEATAPAASPAAAALVVAEAVVVVVVVETPRRERRLKQRQSLPWPCGVLLREQR